MSTETEILAEVEALKARFSDTKALYRETCALLFFRYGITPSAGGVQMTVPPPTGRVPWAGERITLMFSIDPSAATFDGIIFEGTGTRPFATVGGANLSTASYTAAAAAVGAKVCFDFIYDGVAAEWVPLNIAAATFAISGLATPALTDI